MYKTVVKIVETLRLFRAVILLALLALAPGVAPAADGAPTRLIAFGDSLVQGYGLPQGEGLVPQLADWLQQQGHPVEIVNAGVSGETTAGGAARAAWTLSEGGADTGLILLLGGNDMLRALPPAQARENLAQILSVAKGQGMQVLLVGVEAPSNYGAAYKTEFDAIYPGLAAEFNALVLPSIFTGMQQSVAADPARLSALMQDDGIHPSAAGVAANIEVLGPLVVQLLQNIKNAAE